MVTFEVVVACNWLKHCVVNELDKLSKAIQVVLQDVCQH